MAKVSSVERNKKRERMAKKFSGRRSRLAATARNKDLTAEERFSAQLKLNQLPRNSHPNRVVNRCELTGRPKGVYRKFKLSRIALRELASAGLIPGVTKSSW